MAKQSNPGAVDQYDPKIFRESMGNFGTTTKPGADQLTELQAMVRRGVKHVELHLNSQGKGDFGAKDTPDKYGFEERRTIMQLAKLNNQTMSVHATLGVTSFSGLDTRSGGFDESQRLDALRELDENVKFASETAKGGAIVMHMQGENISSSRTDLSLSSSYLKWLKSSKDKRLQEEYKNLQKNYYGNQKDKLFQENPITFEERKQEYDKLSANDKELFKKDYKEKNRISLSDAIKSEAGLTEYDAYHEMQSMSNLKTNKDYRSAVVVGNKIQGIDRNKDFVDINLLKTVQEQRSNKFSEEELKALEEEGILFKNSEINGEGLAKAQAIFQNGKLSSSRIKDDKIFESLKDKLLVKYEKVYKDNKNSQTQADTEYYKKFSEMQIENFKLQKEDLDNKYNMYDVELKRIDELEKEKREVYNDMIELKKQSTKGMSDNEIDKLRGKQEILKLKINGIAKDITDVKYGTIGQDNYQELSQYNERMLQYNEKIKEVTEATRGAKSVADVTFDRNVSGVGYMGIKALKYQLDLKKKSETAEQKLKDLRTKLKNTKEQYVKETNYEKQDRLAHEMAEMQRNERKLVGLKDYADIDIINNPLYIAPENMLPGMGNLCNVEEVKAVIRMSQKDFAEKIMDKDNEMYKNIKADYEKLTGKKIKTEEDALKLAKKHVGGTFDSAHAAAWLKHYRYKKGEDEEQRLESFNKWLNTEAEEMVREGLVKHVHLNDSSGKDDDHNSIGSGILNLHDLRKRLRGAQADGAELDKSFIIEAGGRGADKLMHMDSAFNLFNPIMTDQNLGEDNRLNLNNSSGNAVSDWMSVKRDYNSRPQYSSYGMNDSTFRHQPPEQGRDKGGWSGTSFF